MEPQIDKKALIKALKEMNYVSTESGPVVPSKTKVIKALTKQILPPVSKPQDSDNWDHREYKLNKDLTYGKNLITTRDLYQKVFTEAVTNTAYRGMRLNLASIDMKETHCKFVINRRDHDMMVELFYPNENENITVKITADTKQSNFYEVPLNSPQFRKNFGFTILKSCDQLIADNNTYNLGEDLDTMQTLNGFGNDLTDLNQTLLQPSAMLRESVDGDLAKLLNLCNAVNLLEDGEQAPGADQFAMSGGGMSEPQMDMNGGDINGTDSSNDPDKPVNFQDWCLENKSEFTNNDANSDTGSTSAVDTLAKMVSEKMAEKIEDADTGMTLRGSELYNGFQGMKEESFDNIFKLFCQYFPQLDKAQDITAKQCEEFKDYVNNPGTDSLTLDDFTRKLAEIFPNVYGDEGTGNSMNDLHVPSEDQFTSGTESYNPSEPLVGDTSLLGGGGSAPSFASDGSTADMMDQSTGGMDFGGTEEGGDLGGMDFGGETEPGAGNNPSQQEVDKQDEVIGALTNI